MSAFPFSDDYYIDRRDGALVKVRFWMNKGFSEHEVARVWDTMRCFSYDVDPCYLAGPLNPLEVLAHSADR